MLTERDLEARLRRDAAVVRREAQPDAAFHYRIMARVTAPKPPTPTLPRKGGGLRLPGQFAVAAGFLVVVLALGFVFSRLNQMRPAYRNTDAPVLEEMAMAADPVHRQLVVFGGGAEDGASTADTWTWDGTSWTRHLQTGGPQARLGAAMAYDEARGLVVMFGGGPNPLDDTWTWNGSTWTQAHPALSPPATNGSSMVYDASLREMVLVDRGETWTWDGTNWHKSVPAPGKGGPSIAYDPASRTVVILSLSTSNAQPQAMSTWSFDGLTWTPRPGADIPASWSPTLLAQDPATGGLMGVDGMRRTWSWDGSRWTILNTNKPSALGAMAYDPTRHLVVMFGGKTADSGIVVSDMAVWDGNTWTQLPGGLATKTPAPAIPETTVSFSLGTSNPRGDWVIKHLVSASPTLNELYQSVDQGRTWHKRVQFSGFYDGISWDQAGRNGVLWSIDIESTHGLILYVTTDGGQHWTARSVTSWPAYFADFRGMEGWVQSSLGGGAPAPLYHTIDGGATWMEVGVVPAASSGHTFGVGETFLEFKNTSTGWFATRRGAKPDDSGLLLTRDGGRTWAPQALPAPAGVNLSDFVIGYPWLVDEGHALLPAFAGNRRFLYTSSDGGSTWSGPQAVEIKGGPPTGDEYQNFCLDLTHCWFTVGGAVARTGDGGKTWQLFKSPAILQMQFTDPESGWAVAVTGADNTNIVLRTTDGGAHWRQIQVP